MSPDGCLAVIVVVVAIVVFSVAYFWVNYRRLK